MDLVDCWDSMNQETVAGNKTIGTTKGGGTCLIKQGLEPEGASGSDQVIEATQLEIIQTIERQILVNEKLIKDFKKAKAEERRTNPDDIETYENLKLFRTKLAPPYFKTTNGVFLPKIFENAVECPWKNQNFQKWTNTDLLKLREYVLDQFKKSDFDKLLRTKNEKIAAFEATTRSQDDEVRMRTMFQSEEERYQAARQAKNSKLQTRKRGWRRRPAALKPTGTTSLLEVSCSNPETIEKWFTEQLALLKKKSYKEIFVFNNEHALKKIDWDDVARYIVDATKKQRSADDCYRTFKFALQNQKPSLT